MKSYCFQQSLLSKDKAYMKMIAEKQTFQISTPTTQHKKSFLAVTRLNFKQVMTSSCAMITPRIAANRSVQRWSPKLPCDNTSLIAVVIHIQIALESWHVTSNARCLALLVCHGAQVKCRRRVPLSPSLKST